MSSEASSPDFPAKDLTFPKQVQRNFGHFRAIDPKSGDQMTVEQAIEHLRTTKCEEVEVTSFIDYYRELALSVLKDFEAKYKEQKPFKEKGPQGLPGAKIGINDEGGMVGPIQYLEPTEMIDWCDQPHERAVRHYLKAMRAVLRKSGLAEGRGDKLDSMIEAVLTTAKAQKIDVSEVLEQLSAEDLQYLLGSQSTSERKCLVNQQKNIDLEVQASSRRKKEREVLLQRMADIQKELDDLWRRGDAGLGGLRSGQSRAKKSNNRALSGAAAALEKIGLID